MATTLTAGPSPTQLLFARAVIFTFDLWPALRLAITEQWGGVESKAKADFLISYLCDQYSEEVFHQSSSSSSSNSSNNASASTFTAPTTPDVDDLAEILEGYFADEFESRLEDDSTDWVAARLVQLHKVIYANFPPTSESLAIATTEVNKLEQAAIALRGRKVTAQRTLDSDDSQSDSDEEGESNDDEDVMDVDTATPTSSTTKPEPIIDEDGFTTVVKGNKRR